MLPDIKIFDDTWRAKKRKQIDDTNHNTPDFDIKRQCLSPLPQTGATNSLTNLEGMTSDDSEDDDYDVLCDYLNVLIPSLEWRVNKEKGFPAYEIVNLTQRQAVIVKKQLTDVLNQAVVVIEQSHETGLQNYRLLIWDIDIKYLQKMSIRLHQNRIWLPFEEADPLVSMFDYPSLTEYEHALQDLGIHSPSLKKIFIQNEWNLLRKMLNLKTPGIAENSNIRGTR